MKRWTIQELKKIDDITFAMCILSEQRAQLNPNAPLALKLRSAYHTLERIKQKAEAVPHQNCAHCENAVWFEDRSVGIFGGYECDSPDIPENLDEDPTEECEGSDCPYFKPRLVEQCGNCERKMNVPEWLWGIWHIGDLSNIPCCSHKCDKELSEKEARYEEERWLFEQHAKQ